MANHPQQAALDLYAFTSYETGREDFVTIIANFAPHQNDELGQNIFDSSSLYEINIDSDGDAVEDQTYRFRFGNSTIDENKPFAGTITSTYTLEFIRNKAAYDYGKAFNKNNKGIFLKPGSLKQANLNEIYDLDLDFKKCQTLAKVFVGEKNDSFKANLSDIYDYSANLLVSENSSTNEFESSKVLTIALEIPKECLDLDEDTNTIGVFATVNNSARQLVKSKPEYGKNILFSKTAFIQSSRIANPMVNLLFVDFIDKDLFNASRPSADAKRFATYITNPAIVTLLAANSSLTAPTLNPRTDLEEVYLTGIESLNQLSKIKKADLLRLNTSTPVSTTQNRLGLIGGDNAGYPNGRRPGDDVVDITYRLLFGARIPGSVLEDASLNDGVLIDSTQFSSVFPYL
ncbi:MAG: DUF4331 domain-containing protein [Candidatus Caenarcaniphilales bacterium]|jgi:hypothetical protein|nr:DUF4331 domain-containing protein [Candidatus Caenarcaniphilales bacterium]